LNAALASSGESTVAVKEPSEEDELEIEEDELEIESLDSAAEEIGAAELDLGLVARLESNAEAAEAADE
jgi:hypothetical protein